MLQQYLEAQHWFFETESNSQIHLRPHISWNIHFQWLLSTNTTSLYTGLSKYWVELFELSKSPINSLTLRTLPLLSLYTFTIRAIHHWLRCASCLSNTMSPTWVSFLVVPFFPVLKSYQDLFSPSAPKLISHMLHSSPLLPWISVWIGEITRWWHHCSWFHRKKTSATRVYHDSSVKLLPWFFNNEFRIEQALLICRSQTLPTLLASGGFLFHTIQ